MCAPLTTPASAADAFTQEETQKLYPSGIEHSGDIDGAHYNFTVGMDGVLVNGAIDGAAEARSDLSADPDRWVILPKRDKIEGVTRWYIHHYQSGLMLAMNAAGQITSVCLVGHDYPGEPFSVRVGDNKALKWPGEDCYSTNTALLKSQLLKGGTLITRRYEWPYDYPIDKEGSATYFAQTMKLYMFMRAFKAR
jgi:hypothetical protein